MRISVKILLLAFIAPHANALSLNPSSPKTTPSTSSSRRNFLNNAAAASSSSLLTILPNSSNAITSPPPRPLNQQQQQQQQQNQSICVTGANGYIGLHCVSNLLQKGYSVKAALRSTSPQKTKDLAQIASDLGASDRLSFTSIDLFDVDSMVQASRGCSGMLHLASPFSLKPSSDPIQNIVQPAVAGATNAVRTADILGLQRVVTCGSLFGMVGSGAEKGYDHVYGSLDVNGFNTPKGCTYAYSKMVSQQESMKLAVEKGVDLVTLNVGQVCGPASSADQVNASWEPFQRLASPQPGGGGATLSCCVPGFVDVRDVAEAHVAALGLLSSKTVPRRYVIASRKESPTYVEIAQLLAEILPERNLPTKVEALPPNVQKLVIKGISLGDKSLGELLEGTTVPDGKTLLVDTDPMLKDLVPVPRSVKTTLVDWLENQRGYGHVV